MFLRRPGCSRQGRQGLRTQRLLTGNKLAPKPRAESLPSEIMSSPGKCAYLYNMPLAGDRNPRIHSKHQTAQKRQPPKPLPSKALCVFGHMPQPNASEPCLLELKGKSEETQQVAKSLGPRNPVRIQSGSSCNAQHAPWLPRRPYPLVTWPPK